MDMHHIRYFLALCDTLNFTRAARKCNVSQPALSRAIRQLEEEVGGLLVCRERNDTHITDLGRLLQPQFRQVLADAEGVKTAAMRFLNLEAAEVTLGVMCGIGPRPLMPVVAGFQRAHPGVSLAIVAGQAEDLATLLNTGRIELAIMSGPPDARARFHAIPLYRERLCIACPPGHRFAALPAVPLRALAGEPYLLRTACPDSLHLPALGREQGIDIQTGHASECDDWTLAMAAAGMGVCLVSEFLPPPPGLVLRPLTEPELHRDVSLFKVDGRRLSPVASRLVQAFEAGIPALQDSVGMQAVSYSLPASKR